MATTPSSLFTEQEADNYSKVEKLLVRSALNGRPNALFDFWKDKRVQLLQRAVKLFAGVKKWAHLQNLSIIGRMARVEYQSRIDGSWYSYESANMESWNIYRRSPYRSRILLSSISCLWVVVAYTMWAGLMSNTPNVKLNWWDATKDVEIIKWNPPPFSRGCQPYSNGLVILILTTSNYATSLPK